MYKLKRSPDDKEKTDDRKAQAVLSILREKDPKISSVLLIASHVALYELIQQQQCKPAWQKTEIEGSLFLVERAGKGVRIIIRNNQASDEGDFEQDIDAKVDLETKDNTVFYKVGNSPNSVVRGLWFHHTDALLKFTDILKNFQPPPPRPDPGKALLAALGVGASAGASVSAPVAPVAAPTKISAPPGLHPAPASPPPQPPRAPASAPAPAVVSRPSVSRSFAAEEAARSQTAEPQTDAASLLREALGRGAAATPPPTFGAGAVSAPAASSGTDGRIWVSKADLRMALGEMVLSDAFVNELFARLAKRQ